MTPEADRLASLDAFRGFAVASMVLVNNPGDWGHVYAPLRHADWHGWTFTDMVFPLFLFVAGASMALAASRQHAMGLAPSTMLAGHVRRATVLFAAGLFLNLFPFFDFSTVRIPGVLQRIALCLLIAAPIVVYGGSRAAAVAIGALLLAYTVPMLFVPVPGSDGRLAAGALEPGRDFGAWVDRAILDGHLWAKSKTWDPEGLVSTLPAAASMLAGFIAGRRIVVPSTSWATTGWMVGAGLTALAAGIALDALLMPINKNLWTPSYAVFMTGWSLIAFAAFHAALDGSPPGARQAARALGLPLMQFGRNALALFVLAGVLGRVLQNVTVTTDTKAISLKAWLYAPIQSLPISPTNASLIWALAFIALFFVVAWAMWRRRWFITA